MLVSQFLKENGIDTTSSHLLKKYGDSEIYPKYMSHEEKQTILSIEKNLPVMEKDLAEADARKKDIESEQEKKKEIHRMLNTEVQKAFPKSRYQEVYHNLYESHTKMIALEMMSKAQFEVDGTNIVINGQKNEGFKQPANDLERIMQKSKISFHKPVTLEDLVQKSFEDNSGYSFLIR